MSGFGVERLFEDSATGGEGPFFKALLFDFSEGSGTVEEDAEAEGGAGLEEFAAFFALLCLAIDCLEGIVDCYLTLWPLVCLVLFWFRKFRNLGNFELVVAFVILWSRL